MIRRSCPMEGHSPGRLHTSESVILSSLRGRFDTLHCTQLFIVHRYPISGDQLRTDGSRFKTELYYRLKGSDYALYLSLLSLGLEAKVTAVHRESHDLYDEGGRGYGKMVQDPFSSSEVDGRNSAFLLFLSDSFIPNEYQWGGDDDISMEEANDARVYKNLVWCRKPARGCA